MSPQLPKSETAPDTTSTPQTELREQLDQLTGQKADLEIMLENIVEHSNELEEQIYQQNNDLQAAERHVRQLNADLEERVQERTAQLEAANRDLARESAERKQAQEEALMLAQRLIEQQLQTIEQTYEAVHNGPLQELAVLLRCDLEEMGPQQVRSRLDKLNQDLRGIYCSMRAAASGGRAALHLEDGLSVDLSLSLPDLLTQVFDHTLERDFPGFETLRFYITPDFSPLLGAAATESQKRGICLFLQEALCNVGKHALGTTRLEVVCEQVEGAEAGQYRLAVLDNGVGFAPQPQGSSDCQGSRQADVIAEQLGGQFQRCSRQPQGVRCELNWPVLPQG